MDGTSSRMCLANWCPTLCRPGETNKQINNAGTELFGDNFGTTQAGGFVVYVNGALVPLGEEGLWKWGLIVNGKKARCDEDADNARRFLALWPSRCEMLPLP